MPRWFDTYRAMVAPADLDHLGHMNVAVYMHAVSNASFTSLIELGLGPSVVRTEKLSLAAVHIALDFKKELVAGDAIRIQTTIAAMSDKTVTFQHRMTNVETGDIAMEAKVVGVSMNLDTRRSQPLPDAVRARAQAIMDAAGDSQGLDP